MKVRTPTELQDRLDEEIYWRKKELVDYKFIVETHKKSTKIIPLIRGGIALSYAHWEGFVKVSSSFFVNYVTTKKIPKTKIQLNFITLSYLKRLNKGKNVQECLNLIEEILTDGHSACKVLDKDVIDTRSNLKYLVLKDILLLLGLNDEHFTTKEHFLDKKLVDARNDIAHGTYRDVSYEDYLFIHENIIPLMEHFKTLIQNASVTESFKKI